LRNEYRLFFAEELVPYIDENYNTIEDPAGRVVIGDSFGGNISALISYHHPDVFGLCGLHSGAFWPNNFEAYNLITQGPVANIKWASIWGTYEGLYENMRDFRDFLLDNNYDLEWLELPEGHSWGLWRATIDEMLTYFFPPTSAGIYNNSEWNNMDITVFPNPIHQSASISFYQKNSSSVVLEILDINGRIISTQNCTNAGVGLIELNLDTNGLGPGTYLVKVINISGSGFCKFVKVK
jgi:enterochelin esterase family protein